MEVTMISIIMIILLTYILIGGIMYGLQTSYIVDDEPEFFDNLEDLFFIELIAECLLLWPMHLWRYYFRKIRFSKWWRNNICERVPDDFEGF
jgi:hypothetical protein